MSLTITLSRAARLVGVKRGTLQKKIQQGELHTFEGELLLSELLQAFPQTEIEDTSMLERVESIMENAVNKIIRPQDEKPDVDTLAARILTLGRELAGARREARRNGDLIERLKRKFAELSGDGGARDEQAFTLLKQWFFHALEEMEQTDDDSGIIAKEAFLRVMAAQVRVLPSGHEFFIEGADSILEAGLRGGLALNYGCSNGNCGLCKCKVISGQVKKIAAHDYVLTEAEKGLGYILACSNTAVTDVVLEADEALGAHDIPHQEIEVKAKRIERPDDGVILLQAKTPRTRRLRFLAGQRLTLELDAQTSRDCFIASCPCDDMNLQFHIPDVAGDRFTERLEQLKTNDSLTIKGPRGDFTLDEDSPRSLVFIAVDAGFGPVKSLLEHAMSMDVAEELHLYWITTPGGSHYLDNLCRSWDDALDNLHYTSMRAESTGAVGKLIPGILQGLEDPGHMDFYACVPESVGGAVRGLLLEHGIPAPRLNMEYLRLQPSR